MEYIRGASHSPVCNLNILKAHAGSWIICMPNQIMYHPSAHLRHVGRRKAQDMSYRLWDRISYLYGLHCQEAFLYNLHTLFACRSFIIKKRILLPWSFLSGFFITFLSKHSHAFMTKSFSSTEMDCRLELRTLGTLPCTNFVELGSYPLTHQPEMTDMLKSTKWSINRLGIYLKQRQGNFSLLLKL